MTTKQILEANNIIAEFMGCRCEIGYHNHTSGYATYTISGDPVTSWRTSGLFVGGFNDRMLADNLSFDRSWDWLMKVVEKIESIQDDHDGYYGVFISSNSCTIQGTYLHRVFDGSGYGPVYIDNVVLESKLKSTYQAVINFINWYNNKNK